MAGRRWAGQLLSPTWWRVQEEACVAWWPAGSRPVSGERRAASGRGGGSPRGATRNLSRRQATADHAPAVTQATRGPAERASAWRGGFGGRKQARGGRLVLSSRVRAREIAQEGAPASCPQSSAGDGGQRPKRSVSVPGAHRS